MKINTLSKNMVTFAAKECIQTTFRLLNSHIYMSEKLAVLG